jgi:hypothetical protein
MVFGKKILSPQRHLRLERNFANRSMQCNPSVTYITDFIHFIAFNRRVADVFRPANDLSVRIH